MAVTKDKAQQKKDRVLNYPGLVHLLEVLDERYAQGGTVNAADCLLYENSSGIEISANETAYTVVSLSHAPADYALLMLVFGGGLHGVAVYKPGEKRFTVALSNPNDTYKARSYLYSVEADMSMIMGIGLRICGGKSVYYTDKVVQSTVSLKLTAVYGIPKAMAIKGAKGDKGDKGDRGLQGIKGDKGDPGIAVKVENDTLVIVG